LTTIASTFNGVNPFELHKYYYDELPYDGILYWYNQALRVIEQMTPKDKKKK